MPVMPLLVVAGKTGAASPLQIVAAALGKLLNCGGVVGLTVKV